MDTLELFLLVFCVFVIKSDFVDCEDQSFTIAFMTNIQSSGQCIDDLVLYISASETTNCSIYAPKADFYTEVITSDVVEVQLPRSLALIGSGVEQKGIAVFCNTTVTVYGMNACYQNSDGFSVIPNSHLGNEYFAFTVLPSIPGYHSQIAVVSYIDDTTVCIRLPSCVNCEVSIDSDTYTPGSFIHITLNAFESLQIQSMGDLSGTYIYSNNPVAVFSGNDKTHVGNSGQREHLVTQMPSLQSWGKQYVVVPDYPSELLLSFGDTAGRESSLFVMAGTNDTSVNISCTGATTIQTNIVSAGDIYQMSLSSSEYCLIETKHPVFVVQAIGNDPSLLPLTPIDQYSTNYSFLAPQTSSGSDYQNYFVYVIEDSYLMLDSETIQIEGTIHMKIPGTNLTGGYISLPSRSHKVTHPYANFSGALFGLTDSESYAISLGWNWKTTPQSMKITTVDHKTTCQMSSTSQNQAVSTSTVSSNDESSDSSVCSNNLAGTYFTDMAQGYNGFEIIAEHVMRSIFQCALWCRRQDLCTSFQYNTQTSFLLRLGVRTLDPVNGQIFTLEC